MREIPIDSQDGRRGEYAVAERFDPVFAYLKLVVRYASAKPR
jgi:hypothetical protein